MIKYELEPLNENRKSYYGKAMVEEENGRKELKSYGTHVASTFYEDGEKKLEILGFYSSTTLRHIKEFAIQEGFPAMNKKQLSEYEVES